MWNANTGDEVATLRGHKIQVYCAAFSGEGTRLVTGGMGGILVWDLSQPVPAKPSRTFFDILRRTELDS